MSIYDNVDRLRKLVMDKYRELDNIPDDLLLLSLIKNYKLNSNDQNKLLKYYGSINFERLEFLGDAVLDLIIADILFINFTLATPGKLTIIKSILVKNASLNCLSSKKQLCSLILKNDIYITSNKECADVFEAILGALYYYLKDNHKDPLGFITYWLNKEFNFDDLIVYAINNPNISNTCQYINNTTDIDEINEVNDFEEVNNVNDFDDVNQYVKKSEKLEDLSVDELTIKLEEINKIIELKRPFSPKTLLSNYYQKHKLGNVIYNTVRTENGWITTVKCPYKKCKGILNDNIIGTGTHQFKIDAQKMAAERALAYLELNKL